MDLEKNSGKQVCDDLYIFFLLNILDIIFLRSHKYCYCGKIDETCAFCCIQIYFNGFEKTLRKNRYHRKNLVPCHEQLIPLLMRVLQKDQTAVECFLDCQYIFVERDWYSGEPRAISLRESINYSFSIKKRHTNFFIFYINVF